jgi:hypothetical protein
MERRCVIFTLVMDLDPAPGTFHTVESAWGATESILMDRIPHYNPQIVNASEEVSKA